MKLLPETYRLPAMRLASRGLDVARPILPRWFDGSVVALWCDHRVLMVQSSYRDGWQLPGGLIRWRESPRAAAARELREEVGIRISPGILMLVEEADRHYHTHLFEAQVSRLPLVEIDSREIVEARFMDWNEAVALPMSSQYLRYLKGRQGR